MNGELHQLLLLSSAANFYLRTREYRSLEGFDPEVFRLHFQDEHGQPLPTARRKDAVQIWLHHLKKLRCRGVLAIQLGAGVKDRELSGFAGGGRRLALVARFDTFDEIWTADWRSQRQGNASYWNITYRCRRTTEFDWSTDRTDLERSAGRLEQALMEIGKLADKIGEEHWKINFFDPALDLLSGRAPVQNQLPGGYSERAQRVYAAVYRSWVFGGMGSWNDVPPYSAHEHGLSAEFDACSDALYSAMQEALEAAVNEAAVQE